MMSEIITTLVNIPLSIFNNLTSAKLSSFIDKHKYLADGLDELFVNTFITTIEQHNKHYDILSKNILNALKKEILKDKLGFLQLFCGETTIHNLNDESYIRTLSCAISEKYNLENDSSLRFISKMHHHVNDDLLSNLISDCLHDYKRCFFAHISNIEFMSIVITDLFECGNTLNEAQKILSRIDNRTAWIDYHSFRNSIFGFYAMTDVDYQKTLDEYDQFIINHYSDLLLRGFTPKIGDTAIALRLDEIFVPLQLNQEKVDFHYHDLYISGNNYEPHFINEQDPMMCNQRSVLLGKPGSGKSTLLKHIAVNISKNRKNSTKTAQNIIPVFFKISEYAEANKERNYINLHDFLCNRVETKFRDFINITLLNSNALILVDGLDEVTDKALRIRVAERIEEFISTYPKCQCIVTSRIIGYNEARLRASFKHFQLEDFTEVQIRQFSTNWIRAVHRGWTDIDIQRDADDLFNSIRQNDSVFKLAANPLLMTIIAMIYHKNIRLPNSRIALYEFSTDTFLESWVRLRVNSDSQLKSKDEIIEILRPIAYYIHKEKSDACIGENELIEKFKHYYQTFHSKASDETAKKETREFIDFLRDQAGFFYEVGVKKGERLFSFMHLTFEEYFAGLHLATDFNDGGTLWKEVIFKSRWTEILRLAASYLGPRISRNTATKFVENIMDAPDDFPELGRKESLLCQLFSDDIAVSDECTGKFLKMITDYFASEWARATIDEADYSALFRSNIGKEFWSHCFSTVKSVSNEKLFQGILLDVALDKNAAVLDDVKDKIKQYITEVDYPVFKDIVKGSLLNSFYYYDVYSFIDNRISSHFAEFFANDSIVLFDYMFRNYNYTMSRNYEFYRNKKKNVIRYAKGNPLYFENLKNYCIRFFSCEKACDHRVDISYSNLILRDLFFEVDRIFIETFCSKRQVISRLCKYEENDNSLWLIMASSDGIEYDEGISLDILKADTREQWHFQYFINEKQPLKHILLNFPLKTQKIICYICLGLYNPNHGNSEILFSELKRLGIDSEYCHYWDKYIAEHVNEDDVLDPLFIAAYDHIRIHNFDLSEQFSVINSLMKPFTYEPSPPLSALIKIANMEPISKDLLLNIRDFILNSAEPLRTESLKILKRIVSNDDAL